MTRSLVHLALATLLACSSASTQWLQTSGPEGGEANCFAANGEYLFVGTECGILLSTDNGTSWVHTALRGTVLCHAVKRKSASATSLFAGGPFGLARSTDNWASWTHGDFGLGDNCVRSLAVRDTTIFAGTDSGGVLRSTDEGASWFPVNEGLTNIFVNSLAVIDRDLYAATDSGLFRSSDDGTSWAFIGLAGKIVNTVAAIDTSLFAGTERDGLFRSTDVGRSWKADTIAGMDPSVRAFVVIPPYLFAGTPGGLYRTPDGGRSWSRFDAGLSNPNVKALCVKGAALFAGTYGGVFRSTDGGEYWSKTSSGMKIVFVEALASRGGTLYAGGINGVYRSTNRGDSWSDVVNCWAPSLAIDGMKVYAGTSGHVFYSFDDGGTWDLLWLGGAEGMARALAVNGTELLAGMARDGVLRIGIPTPGAGIVTTTDLKDTAVYALAVSGTNLFAGTEGGVFRSTNGGINWTAVNNGLTKFEVLALAVQGSHLFAGTKEGGMFLSTDDGGTWTPADSGLTDADILSFAISRNNLFAGTWQGGVFLSSNNGTSWSAVNDGLTNSSDQVSSVVHALAIVGTDLYAGTRGAGVWRRPLSEMVVSVENTPTELPSSYSLHQNYPNPFNPSTTIKYELPRSSEVRLSVFDMLGREVSMLVNERRDAGVHEVKFDVSGLSSGVYFYRLQAGEFVQTRKLVLLQ